MSGLSDLSRLLALRALREERARSMVAIAAARLKDAEQVLAMAEAQLAAHDRQVGEQEQRFFAAMGIRPVPENELGRARDRLGVSDQTRQGLIDGQDAAAKAVAVRQAELVTAQAEWRQRLFERDKLAEAEGRLRQQEDTRIDAANEMEAEEMSADRVRMSC